MAGEKNSKFEIQNGLGRFSGLGYIQQDFSAKL